MFKQCIGDNIKIYGNAFDRLPQGPINSACLLRSLSFAAYER